VTGLFSSSPLLTPFNPVPESIKRPIMFDGGERGSGPGEWMLFSRPHSWVGRPSRLRTMALGSACICSPPKCLQMFRSPDYYITLLPDKLPCIAMDLGFEGHRCLITRNQSQTTSPLSKNIEALPPSHLCPTLDFIRPFS